MVSKYVTIIDAGSTSSRLIIYKWEAVAQDVLRKSPLKLTKAFQALNDSKGPIHEVPQNVGDMKEYLLELINAGAKKLAELIGNSTDHNREVPLYVMATAGMRGVPVQSAQVTMHLAWDAIHDLRRSVANGTLFDHGIPDKNTTSVLHDIKSKHSFVVEGKEEGVYAWIALNHGRYQPNEMPGVLELGGKSMQIAYTDPTNLSKPHGYFGEPVCLFGSSHHLTSHSWVLGADESRLAAVEGRLIAAAPATGDIYNPCLPHHQPAIIHRNATDKVGRNSIGSGDFAKCLAFAKAYLNTKPGGIDTQPLPSLDIEPFTNRFYGIATFWYTYDFFSSGGVYNRSDPYDAKLFRKAVDQYCNGSWLRPLAWNEDGIRYHPHIHKHCFGAAWMITLFHGHNGLHLQDAYKGLIRFPSTSDLAERSSWTIGAATMVAINGEPKKYCSGDSALEPPYDETTMGMLETTEEPHTEKTDVVPPTSIFVVESAQPMRMLSGRLPSSLPLNPGSAFSEGLICGFLLMALILVCYRRLYTHRIAVHVPISEEKRPVQVNALPIMVRVRHAFFDKAKGTIFLAGEDSISHV